MNVKVLSSPDLSFADQYFEEFGESQKSWAASPKSLVYCGDLIQSQKISSVLDAGSGLSSYYFHSNFENVSTIDDDPYWASRTQAFVEKNLDRKITITDLASVRDKKFDLVFYDYGNMETRIYNFLPALNMCRRFFYVDDVHVPFYREYVHARCKEYNIQFLPGTRDQYGRYGALIRI